MIIKVNYEFSESIQGMYASNELEVALSGSDASDTQYSLPRVIPVSGSVPVKEYQFKLKHAVLDHVSNSIYSYNSNTIPYNSQINIKIVSQSIVSN
tara:strand:+ start:137 stop:424 length:288 start_codon:yes stop_codon:yes gene_type:complete